MGMRRFSENAGRPKAASTAVDYSIAFDEFLGGPKGHG
jgi:hypothetical protein